MSVYFKMASDSSSELSNFHNANEFSLKKLGKPKLELKREQYEAIRAICFERKDTPAVLLERHDSVVLVVSPLSAPMRPVKKS